MDASGVLEQARGPVPASQLQLRLLQAPTDLRLVFQPMGRVALWRRAPTRRGDRGRCKKYTPRLAAA